MSQFANLFGWVKLTCDPSHFVTRCMHLCSLSAVCLCDTSFTLLTYRAGHLRIQRSSLYSIINLHFNETSLYIHQCLSISNSWTQIARIPSLTVAPLRSTTAQCPPPPPSARSLLSLSPALPLRATVTLQVPASPSVTLLLLPRLHRAPSPSPLHRPVCWSWVQELRSTTVTISVKCPAANWLLDKSPLKNLEHEVLVVWRGEK